MNEKEKYYTEQLKAVEGEIKQLMEKIDLLEIDDVAMTSKGEQVTVTNEKKKQLIERWEKQLNDLLKDKEYWQQLLQMATKNENGHYFILFIY